MGPEPAEVLFVFSTNLVARNRRWQSAAPVDPLEMARPALRGT